jgi:hypothetical protein
MYDKQVSPMSVFLNATTLDDPVVLDAAAHTRSVAARTGQIPQVIRRTGHLGPKAEARRGVLTEPMNTLRND